MRIFGLGDWRWEQLSQGGVIINEFGGFAAVSSFCFCYAACWKKTTRLHPLMKYYHNTTLTLLLYNTRKTH